MIENIIIYGSVFILCAAVIAIYLRKQKRKSREVESKIERAKKEGLYEPVSLHPVVDVNSCIKTGACILACPEKDILGILNGKATTIMIPTTSTRTTLVTNNTMATTMTARVIPISWVNITSCT